MTFSIIFLLIGLVVMGYGWIMLLHTLRPRPTPRPRPRPRPPVPTPAPLPLAPVVVEVWMPLKPTMYLEAHRDN